MSASDVFDPVSMFYSYSHADESIRLEIEKHLATLRRVGLIQPWHNRRIGPGDEWKKEINRELERADIILLLLSPDFIASDYCFEIEARRALERHALDQATVIPILVRPVDLKGLPFSNLQMLPRGAAVISTPRSMDEALKEVAEGIRLAAEKVLDRRLRRLAPADSQSSPREGRVLDAAITHEISMGEFRDVVVLIRLSKSNGLQGILSPGSQKRSYSCKATDVRAEPFEAKYSRTAINELISPEYRLAIQPQALLLRAKQRHSCFSRCEILLSCPF